MKARNLKFNVNFKSGKCLEMCTSREQPREACLDCADPRLMQQAGPLQTPQKEVTERTARWEDWSYLITSKPGLRHVSDQFLFSWLIQFSDYRSSGTTHT